jgi:hypothetical protein
MFYTDWHFTAVDFKSLGGYVANNNRLLADVIEHVAYGKYTHIFGTGDIFDRGFTNISQYEHYMNGLEVLTSLVKGNHYECLGNHFYVQRIHNPELYLIQPVEEPFVGSDLPQGVIARTEPVIRLTDTVQLGCVQVSFHHYNPQHEYRNIPRNPKTKLHIAIFHDDNCLPNSVLQKMNIPVVSDASELASLFAGVDIAYMGHIHLNLGNSRYNNTTVMVPGSMVPTSVKSGSLFHDIELLTIECDDETYTLGSVKFDRGIANMRTRVDKREMNKEVKKQTTAAKGLMPHGRYFSLTEYAEKAGINPMHIQIIRDAGDNKLVLEHIEQYLTRSGG